MAKKKVLLIQRRVKPYRIPVFRMLAESVDLTLLTAETELPEDPGFSVIHGNIKRVLFKWWDQPIRRLAKGYDAVICMLDYSYPQFLQLTQKPRRYKLIYWGIGVDAGYNTRYDGDEKVVRRFAKLLKRADAGLFYTDYPVAKYTALGIPAEKLFVANNTVQVAYSGEGEKDSFLFLGSLYPQKRVDLLIGQYEKALKKAPDLPGLVIIGDGSEREKLETMVKKAGMEAKVTFAGAIFDDTVLSGYFKKALLCLSPDQAGLSVLKSMGNGVPYVTHKNAITGGEIFNIHNGKDGVLLNDFSEMEALFLEAAAHWEAYLEMGRAARQYYLENRTVEGMVQGFIDAVAYATRENTKGE